MAEAGVPPLTRGYRAPSRRDRVQVTAFVSKSVKQALQEIALDKEVPIQYLLCVAINNFLEQYGRGRLADETILPRGGAAHRRSS
jgi:hypothetical protein